MLSSLFGAASQDLFPRSVDKDVPRTDRSMPMFVDSNGPGLKMLHDILMTYGIYNFNLGR